MAASFNLIDSRFIPCVIEGEVQTLNLRDAIVRAHEVQELRDSSPLTTVALHRLLLAILYRVLGGPDTTGKWQEWWETKKFVSKPFDEYFEKWRERFDLFDVKRPFFQDTEFVARTRNGVNQLVRERSRGNNGTLFDHTHEEPPPFLTADETARALITEQMFAVGGGKSEISYTSSGPAASGVIVLVRGDTLFDTLMLNMIGYGREFAESFKSDPKQDRPAWECDTRPSEENSSHAGYVDYLTWQSRTVNLHPTEDGRVQYLSYASGRTFKPTAETFDPMTAYSAPDKKSEFRPLRLSESRDLWRDSASLFQFQKNEEADDTERFHPPANLRWLKELKEDGALPNSRVFSLSTIGLCTDKAKVNFWRHETLPLPLEYLTNAELVSILKSAIAMAEDIGEVVRFSVATFAKLTLAGDPQKSPDKNRQWQMVDAVGADALYWSRLEAQFREFLAHLPGDDEHQKLELHNWFNRLYRTATQAYREAAELPQLDARGQRAAVDGESQLFRSLGKIRSKYQLPKPKQKAVQL
jgi:CRISPR system Cascade subunit CasA